MTKIYAHRGASDYAPENTLPAFERAIALKADGVEIDVHLTKDNQIVVAHDFKIDFNSDGVGDIGEMTYSELSKFNFAKRKPSFGFQRIMRLSEVLTLFKPTDVILNIELKKPNEFYDGLEALVVEAVWESGIQAQVEYSSFNHQVLKSVKKLDTHAITGALYSNEVFEPWKYANTFDANAIHPHFKTLYGNTIVEESRNAGVLVNTWTVDSKEDILSMLALGVDGMITNVPELALQLRTEFLSGS